MPPFLSQFIDPIKTLFNRYPVERRRQLLVSFIFIGLAAVALLTWAFRPQYKALFTDLSLEDSGEIVQLLQKEKIPYRLDQDGRRVLVPSDMLLDTRLKLAANQLPKDRVSGWELFDKSDIGVTDRVQQLNVRRALEGELSRTILQLDPIEAVRVHLVIPEESLFKENQKSANASVTLRMKRGQKLSAAQVEGVSFLVASAVEGLQPENVTILDSRGFILSEKIDSNPAVRLTASQHDLQSKVEATLVQKGQALLDKRFGYGRSALQVTSELNFEQREKTSEIYDADNPAVRSEEVTSSNSMGADTSSSQTENSVTNYELNLTREHVTGALGDIRRLSIAVMVDGKYETIEGADGKKTRDFKPLPQPQLDDISKTIQAALGYNALRGDEISVVSVPFLDGALLDDEELSGPNKWQDMAFQHGQKVMILAGIITLLLMVRSFLKKAQVNTLALETGTTSMPLLAPGMPTSSASTSTPPLPGLAAGPPEPLPQLESQLDSKAILIQQRQDQITTFVADKPDVAARLVRSWLVEDQ